MEELLRQIHDENIETRREAVERIAGGGEDRYVPLLLLAMEDSSWRVRKTAVEVLFHDYPIEKYIDGLIRLLYLEDNAGARNSAIEALRRLGRKATIFLIEAFKTPNKDVRKFLIDVLGEQRDHRSLPLMLDALKDEDENVRATAVEHLGKAGEVSVVDALIEILGSGEIWTAYPAADALGRIGNRKAVPFLVEALKKKTLREPVLKALGRLGDESALVHIIPMLEDPSRNIQEQALRTLGMLYHNGVNAETITAEMRRILGGRTMELIIKHAWSVKREIRISAILLLGLMRDEVAYGPLLELSHEEEFAEDVKNAFVFIGRNKPESLIRLFDTDNAHQLRFICNVTDEIVSPVYYDVLEKMLTNEDGHVRSIAAISLSRLLDGRAVEKIEPLMSDPYEDVQEAAVEALANLKSALNPEALIGGLREGGEAIKKNTARLLGKIKFSEAVHELGFTLKDENRSVRKAAVDALASIGTEEAVKYLTYALADENPEIRISAVLSLGSIGSPGITDALSILTADPDDSVRVAAAKSLGTANEKKAAKSLFGLLNDRSGFVVTAAIESLAAIGGSEAKIAITGMLASTDREVRRTAIIALASFEDVEHELMTFLKDPDWATRIAAVKSLAGRAAGEVRKELEKLLDTEEDETVIKAVEETLRA